MKYLQTLATVDGSSAILIIAACGVCFAVPSITITRDYSFLRKLRLIDCQMQSYNTVTAISSSSGVYILTALCVCITIPSIAIASSNMLLCVNT